MCKTYIGGSTLSRDSEVGYHDYSLHGKSIYQSSPHNNIVKNGIPGGIRTHDLRIRSPARYPLRYGDLTKVRRK